MARIEFEDVRNFLSSNQLRIPNTASTASEMISRIGEFANSASFKGNAATRMGAYLTEVHGSVLEAWQSVLIYYMAVLTRFSNELSQVDPNDNTIIDMAYLCDFSESIRPLERRYEETSYASRNLIQRFFDLFTNSAPDPNSLIEYMTQCDRITVEQMNRMRELDESYRNAFDEVNRLLSEIEDVCGTNLLHVNGTTVVYNSGLFLNHRNALVISEEAVLRMVDSFFDGDDVDIMAVAHLFDRLVRGGSEFEYQVLLAIHMDTRLSLEEILDLYTFIGEFHILLGYESARQELAQRIGEDASERFMAEFENSLRGRSDMAQIELEYMLLRVQLINFVGGVDQVQWSILHSACLYDFRRHDVLLNDPNREEGDSLLPRIRFGGETFYGSSFPSLLGLGDECFIRDLAEGSARDNAEIDSPNWLLSFISLGLMAGGYIPRVSAMTGYTVIKTVMNGRTVYYIIDNATGQQRRMTAAEYQLARELEAIGISRIGGAGAVMQTPNGIQVIGTTVDTNTARINFAGLEYLHGISRADAIQGRIIGDPVVVNYLLSTVEGGARYKFEDALRDTLYYYYSEANIPRELRRTPLEKLDLDILEQLIDWHLREVRG